MSRTMTRTSGSVALASAAVKYLFARAGDQDVFCHVSDFADGNFDQAEIGDALSLEIIASPKGPRGRNIKWNEQAGQA